MMIKYSPQLSDRKIEYVFEGEKITATFNGESDTFDFSQFADGHADNIETTLPFNPIISAERVDGVLYVELLNFIGEDATEDEKFPKWQEVGSGG